MSDRPLRHWPSWSLQLYVRTGSKRGMWAEAYFELLERANDAAAEYAAVLGGCWSVPPCGGGN